jgi:hypothetical protein
MYSSISLAIARERAMEARRAIAQGQDPPTVKPEKKKLTFQEAAEVLIAAKRWLAECETCGAMDIDACPLRFSRAWPRSANHLD